jgi:ubiquinol-cytochrome c reductase cytochrome c1 subunit
MKRLISLLALLPALASLPALPGEEMKLDSAPIDVRDVVSLQAGARTFVNYCLNCHSASMMRYNRLQDLGLSDAQIKDNLLFAGDKVGDLMTVAMTRKDAKEWFGVPPPDLSVIARSRGADWLYTYLRGFYRDPKTVTGWNNLAFPSVAMPHVLWQLQGERVLKEEPVKDSAGNPVKDENGAPRTEKRLETVVPGALTPLEYDIVARDLVNFLSWMAEPNQVLRKQVGIVVVLVLLVLLVLTWLLYREFWKDVH